MTKALKILRPLPLLALSPFLLAPRAALAAEAPPAAAAPAAVTIGDAEVLVLSEPLLSLSPSERAERSQARILKGAKDPVADPALIRVVEGDGYSEIVWDDTVLLTVSDRDARSAGAARAALAAAHAGRIRTSVEEYRKTRGSTALLIGAAWALTLTLLVLLAFRTLRSGFALYAPRLDAWARRSLPPLRLQSIEFLPSERLADGLAALAKGGYIAACTLILYLYIPAVLGIFPWTRGVSQKLLAYFLAPVIAVAAAVIGYIPDLAFILVILAAFHYALKLVHLVFREVSRGRVVLPGFHQEWAEPTFQIARFLAWAFALVVIFPYLPGSSSPAFQGVSVFMGLLLSLGSGSAVANGVAGVIITYMRPFKLGDRVKIGDAVGDVVERTVLVTRIRTIKNVEVTIPNAVALSGHIVNYSAVAQEQGLILHTAVTIGYDVPWPRVHQLLLAAAKATEGLLEEPAPFVLQTALGDFSVCYELNAYTRQPNRMAVLLSELHARIQDRFNEAGVEIMSPVFEVRRDGPASTIPAPYRKA